MKTVRLDISRFALTIAMCFASGSAFAQDTVIPPEIRQAQDKNGWQICNQTSFILDIATTFIREGRARASGWNELYPGACITETPPANSPRYVYAQSSKIHRGNIREWAGTVELCTAETDFISDATDDCTSADMTRRKYIAVNPSEKTTDLIEPENFGLKAETAGLQRLLQSAGYKITRIDGVAGQRTARTIRKFKKDKSLAKSITNDALFEALIEAAKETSENVGLQICNESSAVIWGAMATRHQGGWQSRGWWDIAPNTCAKPFNEPLQGTEAHFFALQESADEGNAPLPDKHLRTVSAVPSQFCIAEAKFSALGRDFCTENGYNIANFRPLSTEQDSLTVTLSDADFTAPNSIGLRR